jgi:tetratricopeptide (TPR) repeat protein
VKSKPTSPILVWTLVGISILCFPILIIKSAVPDLFGPASPQQPLTVAQLKIGFLLDTGIGFQKLGRYETAASWFQRAAQYAEQMPEDQYASLIAARHHLAECYKSLDRSNDAERTYKAMVQTSMETGDALSKKAQYTEAARRFQDAEDFAQNLASARFQALQEARGRQVGCFFALKRNAEAASVTTRMIEAQQELNDPYDSVLAEYYVQLGYARGRLQDWAGAEEAFLDGIATYNSIVRHYSGSYDPEARVENAGHKKDFATMNLAAIYYNQRKMEQALSAAETAYQSLFAQPQQNAPLDLITVGFQSATALGNEEQAALWQQRLNNLCRGPNCPH